MSLTKVSPTLHAQTDKPKVERLLGRFTGIMSNMSKMLQKNLRKRSRSSRQIQVKLNALIPLPSITESTGLAVRPDYECVGDVESASDGEQT